MARQSTSREETCYACEQIAISREHIPPKVFFPEKKDMPNSFPDFRKNLITVPSCEKHNLTKSKDDEYAFMIIAASFDVNHIALMQSSKISRAISYSPPIAGVYKKEYKHASIGSLPTIAPIIDLDRLTSFFRLLAKGIFFNHFHEIWKSELFVQPLSFFRVPDDDEARRINKMIIELRRDVNSFFLKEKIFGSHKEIFFYQFHHDDQQNRLVLHMVFYEGFEVLVLDSED